MSACLLALSLALAEPPPAAQEPATPAILADSLEATQEAVAAINVAALNALIAANETGDPSTEAVAEAPAPAPATDSSPAPATED